MPRPKTRIGYGGGIYPATPHLRTRMRMGWHVWQVPFDPYFFDFPQSSFTNLSVSTQYARDIMYRTFVRTDAQESQVTVSHELVWATGSVGNQPDTEDETLWSTLSGSELPSVDGTIRLKPISSALILSNHNFVQPKLTMESGTWTGKIEVITEMWVNAYRWKREDNSTFSALNRSIDYALGDRRKNLTTNLSKDLYA